MTDELPVHEKIKVTESKTLFKTNEWWKAITLQESFGGEEIAVYLWKKRGDEWVRKQKLTIKDPDKWEEIKNTINDFVKNL